MPASTFHVLLFEDSPANILALRTALESDALDRFDLTCAGQLGEVMVRLRGGGVDLLLFDLDLPGSQGMETFKQIQRQFPAVPVILLASSSAAGQAVEALRSGAQDFLIKDPSAWEFAARAIRHAIVRHQAQRQLRASEKHWRRLIEQTNDAVAVVSGEGTILYESPAAARILGYTPEELVGRTGLGMVHPADQEATAQDFARVLESPGVPIYTQTRFLHKDGHLIWIEAGYTNWLDDPDLHAIIINYRDVSGRKQAEQQLREGEERFRILFETMAQGVVYQDARGQIISANPTAERILGLSLAQMLGRTSLDPRWRAIREDGSAYPGEAHPAMVALSTGRPVKDAVMGVFHPHWNTHRWLSVNVVPQFRPGETCPYQVYSTFEDITERKQAEENLRASEARAQAMFNAVPDMMFRLDREGTFLDYKADVRNLYEQTVSIIGQRNREISPAEFADLIDRKIDETLSSGQLQTFEYQLQIPQAGIQDFEARMAPSGNDEVIAIVRNITERKKVESALQESNETAQAILNAPTESVFLMELDGTVIAANKTAAARMGSGVQELIGKNIYDYIPPAVAKTRRDHLEKVIAEGQPLVFEDERLGVWIENSIYPIFDQDHKVRRLAVYGRDISKRKQSEEDALYRQSLLEKILQLGKIITAVTNLDACLRQIHHSVRKDLGFDRVGVYLYDSASHSILGAYGTDRSGEIEDVHWLRKSIDEWEDWKAALLSPAGVSVVKDFQARFGPTPDHEMYGVKEHVILAAWAGDQPVALLAVDNLTSHREITPADLEALQLFAGYAGLAIANALLHAGLEQRIQERTAELEAIRQRLELANKAASLGVWDWDLKSGRIFWDEQVYAIYRMQKGDSLNSMDSFLAIVEPEDTANLLNFAQAALAGQPVGQVEFRIARGDGSVGYIKAHGVVQHDAADQPANIIGVVQDITQEKLAERNLRESEAYLRLSRDQLSAANTALEKAARMKDEFLASMSHELRTPLTGILGLSEALQLNTYGSLSDKQKRALKNIEDSGRHLLTLINDILDLSKIEAGMLELEIEPVSLVEICQAGLQLTKGMAHKKRQSVEFKMTPPDIRIQGDVRRLKQMLVNLLSNAIKFTPENGSLGLDVSADEEGQVVRLAVWDKGIGIAPENLEKLFQPFVQLESSLARQYEGTGLGLSLVQRMADLHGGSVEVESSLGMGSRFTLCLPWSPEGGWAISRPPAATPGLDPASGPVVDASRPLVLVVDDNEMIIDTLCDFLTSQNFRVAAAHGGAELLQAAPGLHPEVILMDIQMPGMDGFEAIRRIRAHPDPLVARAQIIAVTALAMAGDRERCLAAGATEYLSKPVALMQLLQMVRSLLKDG